MLLMVSPVNYSDSDYFRFTDWSNVVEWTQTSPKEVLALLIKAGDFDTAKNWCKLQKLSEELRLVRF